MRASRALHPPISYGRLLPARLLPQGECQQFVPRLRIQNPAPVRPTTSHVYLLEGRGPCGVWYKLLDHFLLLYSSGLRGRTKTAPHHQDQDIQGLASQVAGVGGHGVFGLRGLSVESFYLHISCAAPKRTPNIDARLTAPLWFYHVSHASYLRARLLNPNTID